MGQTHPFGNPANAHRQEAFLQTQVRATKDRHQPDLQHATAPKQKLRYEPTHGSIELDDGVPLSELDGSWYYITTILIY